MKAVMAMRRGVCVSIFVASLTSVFKPSISPAAGVGQESGPGEIRLTADGAGPSHIFWLSGPAPGLMGRDVVAIADPLLSAIRLYHVNRDSDRKSKLEDRLHRIGACAMPINFRPWRILQRADGIHIEGMPDPGKDRHNAKKAAFTSAVYSLKRDLASEANKQRLAAAGTILDTNRWDPAAAIQCGTIQGSVGPVGRTAPFTALRQEGNRNRTIVVNNTKSALSGQRTLKVRARAENGGGYYLYSAKELEPAGATSVVQITEGAPTSDGILRLNQRLLLFDGKVESPFAEVAFADTHFRSKLGQKPLAVLPTGEVLAMGKQSLGPAAEKVFRMQSCGYVAPKVDITGSLCSGVDFVSSRAADIADTSKPPSETGTFDKTPATIRADSANAIFRRLKELQLDDFPWKISASQLPDECRNPQGCLIKGQGREQKFVPLKGIRLSRGDYTGHGVPYAQTERLAQFDRFFDAYRERRFEGALRDVVERQQDLPGNLADHMTGDLGIDCSALVQLAWNGRPAADSRRWDTSSVQNLSVPQQCRSRVSGPEMLVSGDAIGINVKGGAEHIVLYAAMLPFDGASEFWLVHESSSSCDGVCWSVYDPSFFNGWGLYRSEGRSDAPCERLGPTSNVRQTAFPGSLDAWHASVTSALPKNRTVAK